MALLRDFLGKHSARRLMMLGGALIGVYFLGAKMGWWERFLF
jgi:hypothetical protein